MKSRVVMVDDEESLVWTTSRQLSRERPDVAFEGFVEPAAALARVAEAPPDLLITDVRMPGIGGLELLVAARRHAPGLPVLVVTAYGSGAVRRDVMRLGGVDYLEKPFGLPALLEFVDRATRKGKGFSGAVSLPKLPDLVQLYAQNRADGALAIRHGPRRGTLWFEAGDVVHVETEARSGLEAFVELMDWPAGEFSMEFGAPPPRRTVEVPWEELLLESCRRLDESLASRSDADGAEAPLPPDASAPPGTIWPPVEGRTHLLAACERPISLVRGASGDWLGESESGWTLHSPGNAAYPDWEEGVPKLVEWARRHALLQPLLSPRRCIALAHDRGRGTRLWQCVAIEPSLRARLERSLRDAPPDAVADELVEVAALRARAEARMSRAPGLPSPGLDVLGSSAGEPVFIGLLPWTDEDGAEPSARRAATPEALVRDEFGPVVGPALAAKAAGSPGFSAALLAALGDRAAGRGERGELAGALARLLREEEALGEPARPRLPARPAPA